MSVDIPDERCGATAEDIWRDGHKFVCVRPDGHPEGDADDDTPEVDIAHQAVQQAIVQAATALVEAWDNATVSFMGLDEMHGLENRLDALAAAVRTEGT